MMSLKITKIATFFPDQIITNEELALVFDEISAEKIEQKVGIKTRHITSESETALDLAYGAAEKLLQEYERLEIDFLLFCTQSPDYFLPTSACILQHKLRLRTDIGALDYNLGCSGYIYGLALAKGLLSAGIAKNILLLTSETYSKFIHHKDRSNRTIFGDGAAATLIEQSTTVAYQEFVLGTDGEGAGNLIVPRGSMRSPFIKNLPLIEYQKGSFRTENDLYMNGPEIFNFTIRQIPELVHKVCHKNDLSLDEIDYVIFHQANIFILDHLRKKLKIPKEKFYMNMSETGNTVSSTIPIALKDAMENKFIKQGDKVLLVGFGVGYSIGAVIIQF